ncbi:MAG TPA: protein kinase [Polyangia bacterium]|nr:protein kinase [Polyangia bacterium]
MSTAARPGLIRDRYEIARVLGEGAFARTLLCNDRQQRRQVAVKQLRVRHVKGDWKAIELFEREARVLASLRHHGVPEVYEFFEAAEAGEPSLFLVQEFVDGSSLKQRIEKGPLPGEIELVQITLGVLDVLEYLHGRTPPVYHRDVKPSNIVVRPTGVPVLVDFGGVCFGWRPPSEAGSTIVGTYGYMPPEQLVGQVSPTSDLYALGATLLHVITGRAPGDFPFDSGRIEVPADLPVRPALRELISALLEPAPRNRPSSARAAREILLRSETTALAVRPGSAVVPRGASPLVDVGPPPRDPRGAFAAVYGNLVDIIGFSRVKSKGVKALAVSGWVGLGLITGGIVPLIFHAMNLNRRRQYEPLFRNGLLTTGRIVSARYNRQNGFAAFAYEYEVEGVLYRAAITYPPRWLGVLVVGDRVAVLFDPKDPGASCFLVR